jgi:hypothetical protein
MAGSGRGGEPARSRPLSMYDLRSDRHTTVDDESLAGPGRF